MMYNKGWDCFYHTPNTVSEMACRVCNEILLVERNQLAETSFTGALSQLKRWHDFFYCQHSKEKWHEQLLKLRKLIEETPSKKLQIILEEEINEILITRTPTIRE